MNSPSEDLATLLNGQFGLSLGGNLFAFEMGFNDDVEVDKQVAIFDTGSASVDGFGIYENPTLQVIFRGDKIESGKTVYDFAKPIFDFIMSITGSDQNDSNYSLFHPLGDLNRLGRDDEGRYIYTANLYAYRTEGV